MRVRLKVTLDSLFVIRPVGVFRTVHTRGTYHLQGHRKLSWKKVKVRESSFQNLNKTSERVRTTNRHTSNTQHIDQVFPLNLVSPM